MIYFGLHIADWTILGLYVASLLWLGKRASSRVHGQSDFFLAGRHLGKIFQFFLNFGNMTDAASAARTSSVVYSQGVGGVWISFQTLFMTPYYWFMNPWFRRTRLTTVGDIFLDRFNSKFLALLYAVVSITIGTVSIGGGFLVAYKILQVFIAKPEASYTVQEKQMVERFQQYTVLDAAYKGGTLAPADQQQYQILKTQHARGDIKSYVSYVRPIPVYAGLALIIGLYVTMGGLTAAAVTDALQGLLIVFFSIILLPFGFHKLGGFGAFREHMPNHMLDLFGSGAGSEFAWYSIMAILLISTVQIHAESTNMTVAGSAQDETSARFGAVSGGFAKRFMIVAWCFCGLIAFALFGPGLSDPDAVWGALCRSLLGPGFFGLMLAGILSAEMSLLSSQCLAISALFVRNFYQIAFPGRGERTGLFLGRVVIGLSLLGGIGVALMVDDMLVFMKIFFSLNVAFGAAVLVTFKWNRVTSAAVIGAVILCLLVVAIIPLAVPLFSSLSTSRALQVMTHEQREITHTATGAEKVSVIAPRPVLFERIIPADPADPKSSDRGTGRFHLELYLLSLAGLNLAALNPAQLLTLIYVFDSVFPFVLLFGLSLVTRQRDPEQARRFYVKMRTRVSGDPAEDARRLTEALQNLESSEKVKLFPGSSWELLRWNRQDAVGFFVCCAIALGILGGFATLLSFART